MVCVVAIPPKPIDRAVVVNELPPNPKFGAAVVVVALLPPRPIVRPVDAGVEVPNPKVGAALVLETGAPNERLKVGAVLVLVDVPNNPPALDVPNAGAEEPKAGAGVPKFNEDVVLVCATPKPNPFD